MKRFFYRLGGTNYDVIRHLDADTQTKYQNIARSLLLSTGLAFIGGADVARQFTHTIAICIGVGLLWALAVFFYDYFIINSGGGNIFFKIIRVPVGICNVFITVTALFVLLNQSTIDTNLRLTNAGKITNCDSAYLAGKQIRYAALEEKQKNRDAYHQKNCVPEAGRGYPDKLYAKKHSLCITTDSAIAQDRAKLDTAEKTYFGKYQVEKEALLAVNTNDFFKKASLLPDIIRSNLLILVLAICLFVFLSYLELQSLMLKFSISTTDEYHVNLRTYLANRKGLASAKMDNQLTKDREQILLDKKNTDEEVIDMHFKADMQAIDAMAIREYEIQAKKEIAIRKGYPATAEELDKLLQKYTRRNAEGIGIAAEIFRMTQSMVQQVEEIKKSSTPDNLPENIFNWVLNNITYDNEHTKEHYRTARETYNEKRGICGELSVLLIAFCRTAGIQSSFCEVTKDDAGKEVSHAAVMIKQTDGSSHLADVAYKNFRIEHKEYHELSDIQLQAKYDSWNT